MRWQPAPDSGLRLGEAPRIQPHDSAFLAESCRFSVSSSPYAARMLDEAPLLRAALAHVERNRMHAWGVHGVAHWWRVRHNGLVLAPSTGADATVVRLFAIFHDSHREDDFADPQHGPRAAEWLARVRSGDGATCPATFAALESLGEAQFEALRAACELHTSTLHHDDPTVATCFAADRLDLWRVRKRPNPKYIPIAPSILTDQVVRDAIARTEAGLRWTDAAEFARLWQVEPPSR